MNNRQKFRKGLTLITFFLFPAVYYYFSPVLIVQAAMDGIINGSFIVFILLFFSSLFFGRANCGWICPAAGCQEAIFTARDKKVTKGNFIKWVIWIPWISTVVYLLFIHTGVKEIDFLYRTEYGISVSNLPSFLIYLAILLLLIVLPCFIFGRRSFCHHICWMAPFMILGRKIRNTVKWPSLHLQTAADSCKGCKKCTKECPMSLPVEDMVKADEMENSECILCGNCVDVCKFKAIEFGFFDKNNDSDA